MFELTSVNPGMKVCQDWVVAFHLLIIWQFGPIEAASWDARIWIDSVQDTTSDKYVRVMGVCREDVTGSNPGCNTGGENAVAIVK